MKPKNLRDALCAFASLCLLALSFATVAHAQTGIGSVRGRVLNQTTGEYLEGAFVSVLNSEISASTNLQGEFLIRNVTAGKQRIRASYLGLGEIVQEVDIQPGVTVSVSFGFKEDVVMLEGMNVEATVTGRSAAVNQQRVATGIKNIVNQDDFGQMNDGNIAQAIRRMPGVSADTDGGTEVPRYVNIRGFDASLNSVTLDGNRLSTSESGTPGQRGGGTAYGGAARAFALDDVPADAITNVEIVKAPTPDMDGAALGGSVNLVTKTAFEREGRTLDYRLAGTYSELRDEFGTNAAITYSDILNLGGGVRNFGLSLTLSRYDQAEGFDNIDYDYLYLSPAGDGVDLTGVAAEGNVNDYLADQLSEDRRRSGQVAVAFNEDTEYNNYNIDRKRNGFSSSLDFKLTENTEFWIKPTFNREERTQTDFRHHLIMDNNHGDVATPLRQWVSLLGAFEPGFNNGNYSAFLSAANAAGLGSRNFNPGDSITRPDGSVIVFNPGSLVRLGSDPDRISSIRPGSGAYEARTTYLPTGAARGRVGYEGNFIDTEIELMNLNVGGVTRTAWGEIDFGAYYSETKKENEAFETEWFRDGFQFGHTRFVGDPYRTVYTLENDSQVSRFELPSATPSTADGFIEDEVEHKRESVQEEIIGFNLDVLYQLPRGDNFTGFLKAGVKYTANDRDYDYDEKEWDPITSNFPFESFLFRNTEFDPPYGLDRYRIPFVPNSRQLVAATATNPELFRVGTEDESNLVDSVQQDYLASEDTLGLYFMGNLTMGRLNIVTGLRWEQTDFSTTGYLLDGTFRVNPSTIDVFTVDERTAVPAIQTRKRTYDEYLPSLHMKYQFTDNLIGRVSIGRTYAKPSTQDMVGSTFVDLDNLDQGEVGIDIPNFELPTQQSLNLDISLEYYTQRGRYGVGFFRKDMNNYAWNETTTTLEYPGYEGLETTVSQPIANTDAVNQGIEVFIYQNLGIFGRFLSPFSFNGNYTFTESEAVYYTGRVGPTIGHSKEMYNLSLAYERFPFFARLNYQFRSKYFENISISDFAEESEALAPELQFIFDDVFMNPGTLDLELGYKFSNRFEVFANITNLRKGINASRQGYFGQPEDSYPHQRRFTFGIKGRF